MVKIAEANKKIKLKKSQVDENMLNVEKKEMLGLSQKKEVSKISNLKKIIFFSHLKTKLF